ncbi:DNA cytosine methyltransferase [Empedobacter sedimenti]|uniref:DNA cytosine methyltransferase n=1 Tax=Empedobacter sedimenti TaxID=3042610 RepID=UPI0024A73CB7|nr:DNA cytosine methyltransferase [Empedobacter sedimenti]
MIEYIEKNYKNPNTKIKELFKELDKFFELENIELIKESTKDYFNDYSKTLDSKIIILLNIYYETILNNKEKYKFLEKYLIKSDLPTNNLMIDLFAGCGGLSLGLNKAGFNSIFVNEIEPIYGETYFFNHSLPIDNYFIGDINELIKNKENKLSSYKNIDIVCGGPPCQGFSMANRQRVIDDPRNNLYKSYLEVLEYIQPKFFIMENVKGMLKKAPEILEDFRSYLGEEYNFSYYVFNAKDYGVPQNRERFILIGNRIGINSNEIIEEIKSKASGKIVPLGEAIYDLPILKPKDIRNNNEIENSDYGFTFRKNEKEKNTDFLNRLNSNQVSDYIFNHKNRYNNERDIEIFSRLPQGANSLHESIKDIMPYSNRNHMFKDKYFKLDETKISKTMTSHMKFDCNMYIHPNQARGLSPREAARIQTFPDDYFFKGSQNHWYAQIGNAVPVLLAEAIGKTIKKYI